MRGLRPKFPALRERLQEKLAAAFEHEIRGPKDCNGISSCQPNFRRGLSGNRLDQSSCQRSLPAHCR